MSSGELNSPRSAEIVSHSWVQQKLHKPRYDSLCAVWFDTCEEPRQMAVPNQDQNQNAQASSTSITRTCTKLHQEFPEAEPESPHSVYLDA